MLNELKNIMIPPQMPLKTGNVESWKAFERDLGIDLPNDYKEFINIYGSGAVDGFIWVRSPFDDNENLNFITQLKVKSWAYSVSKEQFPEDYPFEIYPNKGGLLSFGTTDNGDELYWLTEGNPDNWSIIVYDSRSAEYYRYYKSLTSFFYEVLTKNDLCPIFPDDFPSESPIFLP